MAVRDGRILGAGSLDELAGWGAHTVDERFADKVLMPGLVEGHSHVTEGTFWRYAYVGFFDRTDPDGRVWPGANRSTQSSSGCEAPRARRRCRQPLAGWALDPIYYGKRRCTRHDLDRVSTHAAGRRAARERAHPERQQQGARARGPACARASTIPACRSARTACRPAS